MTAQVEGTEKIIDMAHKAGNWDVTVRTYPIANHVPGLGDESNSGISFADAYVDDVISWAVGITRGLQQTSERGRYQLVSVDCGAVGIAGEQRADHLSRGAACQHGAVAAGDRRAGG